MLDRHYSAPNLESKLLPSLCVFTILELQVPEGRSYAHTIVHHVHVKESETVLGFPRLVN